jgi:hypothetical protein
MVPLDPFNSHSSVGFGPLSLVSKICVIFCNGALYIGLWGYGAGAGQNAYLLYLDSRRNQNSLTETDQKS